MTQVSSATQTPDNIKAINGPADNVDAQDADTATLGHGDFLRLMVAQLQQQDPFEPVDNKDMLAQMAQFSALAGSSETNDTLAQISDKLDALIAVQKASGPATPSPTTATNA